MQHLYAKRIVGVFALLLSLGCGLPMAVSAREDQRSNVLFIAVDDLRPELGCYAATLAEMRNRLMSQLRASEDPLMER